MNINFKDMVSIDTLYNIKKYRDDKLIQEENTHNIITNRVFNTMGAIGSSYTMSCLIIGDGNGEPTATNTQLNHYLFGINGSRTLEYDENSITSIMTFTFPATSNYVGNLTECGLSSSDSNNGYLYTHALFRDAAGNPISIEKTDLDIFVITVRFKISFTLPEDVYLVNLRYSQLYAEMSVWGFPGCLSSLVSGSKTAEIRYTYLSQDYQEIIDNGVETYRYYSGVNFPYSTIGCSHSFIYPDSSITADIPSLRTFHWNQRVRGWIPSGYIAYIKAIVFFGLFIIPLPNETYFPEYDIQNIEIGTGDGIKTEFINPFNYFKQNSEKIYKNGQLLVRGTDYTIKHNNNRQGLSELFASADAIITGGYKYVDYKSPIFRPHPSAVASPYSSNYIYTKRPAITSFSKDAPLYLDMQKNVEVNFLRIGTNYANQIYKLYYKPDDNSEYELLTTLTKTSSVYEIYFDTVIARYFMLTVENSAGNSISSGEYNYVRSSGENEFVTAYSSIAAPQLWCALGYRDEGKIVFTEAPAVDDVLTIDVTMDIPLKTENNVIDYDFTMTF